MAYRHIARPYARAAFAHARANDSVADWSDQLGALAAAAREPRVAALIADPRLTRERHGAILQYVLGDQLDTAASNLVRLLASNGRLAALPEIADEFEHLRARAENRVDAEAVTAFELDSEQQQRLADALGRRLDREIRLTASVDEELIGGVVVRAGDLVIDASVRGHLQRLANRLGH